MSTPGRYIVVTPYYKEDRRLIERCIASVRAQTVPVVHLLIADGFAQDWIDELGIRHLRLDAAHGDYGNTPRGVGALLAAAEGYDAVALLDADNWLEPRHFELCLTAAQCCPGGHCDIVFARRNLMRPDETRIEIADERIDEHVDTNCYFYLPGSYHMLHHWALMPRGVAALGDRAFFAMLRSSRLIEAIVDVPTVNYHAMAEGFYRVAGETPPTGAKPDVDVRCVFDWISRLDDRQHEIASRHAGLALGRPVKATRKD